MHCMCGKLMSDHIRATEACNMPPLGVFGQRVIENEGAKLPSNKEDRKDAWRKMILNKPKANPPVCPFSCGPYLYLQFLFLNLYSYFTLCILGGHILWLLPQGSAL